MRRGRYAATVVGERAFGAEVPTTGRNAATRQWALEAGIELPGRGRIAREVQQAYDAGDVPALYAATGLEME
jgi:hypothetical protein